MTPEQAEALLAPFPAEAIGKLPRIVCPACSKAQGKVCPQHRKIKCAECENWISERHIHLDYVGHAITTKRLLDVDPEWMWEPVAIGQYGQPVATDGGLWIRLTVCGVTRYGWGDGPDMKQMISDAIRNAAMRFGVALDLWSKEDLRASDESEGANERGTPPTDKSAASGGNGPASASASSVAPAAGPSALLVPGSRNRVGQLQSRLSAMLAEGVKGIANARTKRGLPKLDEDCTADQLEEWADLLNEFDPVIARDVSTPADPDATIVIPVVEVEPMMSRAESQTKEAARPVEEFSDDPF